MKRITKEIFSILKESDEVKEYSDELMRYIYDETTYDVDRDGSVSNINFPEYDYFNDYIMSIDKKSFDEAVEKIRNALSNVKLYNDSDGTGVYLELSDNHTMYDLNDNGKSEEEWYSIVKSKEVEFENETDVPLRFLGRSARHVCVDLNLENIINYDKLKEVQERLEDEAVAEFNDEVINEGTSQKRVARYNEFDNGKVIHSWSDMSDEEAEEQARQASLKDDKDVYYVQYDNVMNPTSKYVWYKGERYDSSEANNIIKSMNESDDINDALADDIRKVADIEPGSDEDQALNDMSRPIYGVTYDCIFRSGDLMARQYQIQSDESFSLLLKLSDDEPGTWIDVNRVEPDDWTWEFNQYIFSDYSDEDKEAKKKQEIIDEKYAEDVLQIIYDFAREFGLDKDDLDEAEEIKRKRNKGLEKSIKRIKSEIESIDKENKSCTDEEKSKKLIDKRDDLVKRLEQLEKISESAANKDYELIEAKEDDLDKLYDDSAFTFEGFMVDDENLTKLVNFLKENTEVILPIKIYRISGEMMNSKYGLTEDNAYPDDLNIVSLPLTNWKNLGNLPSYKIQIGARWFDDIVDNNRMRQEEINMPEKNIYE